MLPDEVLAGLGFLIVSLAFVASVIIFVFCAWTFIDAVKRPDHEWLAAGQNKVVWLVVLGGSWLIGLSLLAALVYWFWPRRALVRAQGGHADTPPPLGYGPH
jgi:hypothetical protein